MALDFHQPNNNALLFSLDDSKLTALADIFETFTHWTGLTIDPYGQQTLTTENQQTLIRIINQYIDTTNLNQDKEKTSAIIEFQGLLKYFVSHSMDVKLTGD